MINYETKNKSFLKVAKEINQTFMLELKNEKLKDVDPFDPKIRREDKMAVLLECTINPWYYLREIVRFTTLQGEQVQFILDRASCAQIWMFLLGYDTFTHKGRQLLKTGTALGILSWVMLFKTESFDLVNVSLDQSLMSLNKLNHLIYNLPSWITSDIERSKYAIKNGTTESRASIYSHRICHELEIFSGPTNIQFYDEFEFINNIEDIYANASVNNSEFGNIITSTLGHKKSESYKFARKILEDAVEWNEYFYLAYYRSGGKKKLDETIKGRLVHIDYPFYMVTEDPENYYLMSKRAIDDEEKFKREVLLIDK